MYRPAATGRRVRGRANLVAIARPGGAQYRHPIIRPLVCPPFRRRLAVPFSCPYCDFVILVKTPKAGRFTPKCPKCTRPFVLVIPADLAAEWTVEKLAAAGDATEATQLPKPAYDATEATQPPPPKPRPPLRTKPTPDYEAVPATDDFDRTAPAASATRPDAGDGRTLPGAAEMADDDADDAPPPRPAPPADGEIDVPGHLGGYKVVKELGRGGMGAVYLGRQVSLDRPVALKVMDAALGRQPGVPRPLHPRGLRRRPTRPPQRRPDLRHRRGPRRQLLLDGVRRGQVARRRAQEGRPGGPGRRRRVRAAGGPRAEVRPRPRHDPPGREARQPHAQPPGRRQGGRPRAGQDGRHDRRRRPTAEDRRERPAGAEVQERAGVAADRHDAGPRRDGVAGLYVAGAVSERRRRRSAGRRVLARLYAVRPAGRPAAVPGG